MSDLPRPSEESWLTKHNVGSHILGGMIAAAGAVFCFLHPDQSMSGVGMVTAGVGLMVGAHGFDR